MKFDITPWNELQCYWVSFKYNDPIDTFKLHFWLYSLNNLPNGNLSVNYIIYSFADNDTFPLDLSSYATLSNTNSYGFWIANDYEQFFIYPFSSRILIINLCCPSVIKANVKYSIYLSLRSSVILNSTYSYLNIWDCYWHA